MIKTFGMGAALLLTTLAAGQAHAASIDFSFLGPGVNGSLQLTYGAVTDSKTTVGFEITNITGFFTDTNNGLNIINAPILSLVGVTHDTPEVGNLLAPNDFSRFAVATGLDPMSGGFLTYDNLVYPGGSPPTATDYMFHGGIFDIYGVLFNIGGGKVVDLWSNGDLTGVGGPPLSYGVAVATSATALDYVGGVAQTPEPGALSLVGAGLAALIGWRRVSRKA